MSAARGLASANDIKKRLVKFTGRLDVEEIGPARAAPMGAVGSGAATSHRGGQGTTRLVDLYRRCTLGDGYDGPTKKRRDYKARRLPRFFSGIRIGVRDRLLIIWVARSNT